MSSPRDMHSTASLPWRFLLSAALAALLLAVGPAAFTDDTQLLRFDTAKPYVFFVLDTSASMGLAFDTSANRWTPGGADGPGSRLYQAKQALYNTFRNVADVHFGFASYNQDQVRAIAKHWIYYHNDPRIKAAPVAGDPWPIPFPLPEEGGLTTKELIPLIDEDGTEVTPVDEEGNPLPPDTWVLDELEGHVMTFGRAFGCGADPVVKLNGANANCQPRRDAGSCGVPLDFNAASDQRKLQSFAIDGLTSFGSDSRPTRLWLTNGLKGGNLRNYLLTVTRPSNQDDDDASPNPVIGEDGLQVVLSLYEYSSCPYVPAVDEDPDHSLRLTLRLDPQLNQTFFIDAADGGLGEDTTDKDPEIVAGMWDHQDAVSEAGFAEHPFTGEGWEGNYDSGGMIADQPGSEDDAAVGVFQTELEKNLRDPYCANPDAYDGDVLMEGACTDPAYFSPVRPTTTTVFDSLNRHSLDRGDMIPFHWTDSRQGLLLDKLAPNRVPEPDFRAAPYFANAPTASSPVPGSIDRPLPLPLLSPARPRPLLALDQSPLARAINDVRCWYLGTRGQGTNKCKGENPLVDVGWEEVACENDSRFGCRKPYMILITDGEDNIKGENPTADVGDLFGASGMRTWILNLGHPSNCETGLLRSIIQAGGQGKSRTGECINVSNGRELRQELESIVGQIRTETRAFASAAVPTVQATVEQKIFLTNFTPFNDSGVWDGHVQSFLKPLPVDETTGKPNTDRLCTSSLRDNCYLWDSGANMLDHQYAVTTETQSLAPSQQVPKIDVTEDQRGLRRVFYVERAEESGRWAAQRHIFQQPPLDVDPTLGPQPTPQHQDLWEGFGIDLGSLSPPPGESAEEAAEDLANRVIQHALREKTGTVQDTVSGNPGTPVTFLLGDIFHSTPQVVGTPANVFYFASDYPLDGAAGGDCLADPDTNANKGYRCFFQRQRLRRKMLLVGANDGQLHAFDAGRFRGHDDSSARDHFTQSFLKCDLVAGNTVQDCTEGNPTPFGSFDNGTGLELFSYVPRPVMPLLREQEELPAKHFFSVDGNITVADVFIDPLRNEEGSAFPVDADREWRTVAIGGLREGGIGYYALDITAPDPLEADDDLGFVPVVDSPALNDPEDAAYLPQCLDSSPVATGCGDVTFPSVAWEFTDSFFNEATDKWYLVDEDLAWMEDPDTGFSGITDPGHQDFPEPNSHGVHDLGATWSTANVGLIRVCRADGSQCAPGGVDVEDRFVAIFGGGMDVGDVGKDNFSDGEAQTVDPLNEYRGNWLYMVDIETGETIYKQRLDGAAPSEPAAVDTNGDALIDRIYIGTLAGYLYRVDVGTVNGSYPALEPTTTHGIAADGTRLTVQPDRIPRNVWRPVKLFDTNQELVAGVDGEPDSVAPGSLPRPIYYRPSVIFRSGQSDFALAFGTGDREDLWSLSPIAEKQNGRFYVVVDEFASTADISTPLNEGDLTRIDAVATPVQQGGDLLATGGWYLVLGPDERVITEPFALSGITIFSAYVPKTFVGEDVSDDEDATTEETDRACGDNIEGVTENAVCSLRGVSNIYVVNTLNADGVLTVAGTRSRFKAVADFVTNPFTEPGQTKTSGDGDGEDDGATADELTPDLAEVMESLKALFPPQCKFANYRVDIKTIAADTSLQFIAPVPVCIIEHNWKEY